MINLMNETYTFQSLTLSSTASTELNNPQYVLAFRLPDGPDPAVTTPSVTVGLKAGMTLREMDLFQRQSVAGPLKFLPSTSEVLQIKQADGTVVFCTNIGGVWRWI